MTNKKITDYQKTNNRQKFHKENQDAIIFYGKKNIINRIIDSVKNFRTREHNINDVYIEIK